MRLIEKIVELVGILGIMSLVSFFIGLFKATKRANKVIEKETGFNIGEWLIDAMDDFNEDDIVKLEKEKAEKQKNKSKKKGVTNEDSNINTAFNACFASRCSNARRR